MRLNNRRIALLGMVAAAPLLLANAPGPLDPKPASPATITAQQAMARALPADDGRDAEFANRGFVATLADPVIKDAKGRAVWNLAAYEWVDGPAPASVNPSLWRLMRHLKRHGLFKVADGEKVVSVAWLIEEEGDEVIDAVEAVETDIAVEDAPSE